MILRRKYTAQDYHEVGESVKKNLAFNTEIVPVKFIKNQTEIPDGLVRPVQ